MSDHKIMSIRGALTGALTLAGGGGGGTKLLES